MTYSEPSLPNLPIFTYIKFKKKYNLKKLLPFLRLLDKALYIVRLPERAFETEPGADEFCERVLAI